MNFLQWDSSGNITNIETDAQYLIDAVRIGGAMFDTAFQSALGNKVFYQLTTFVTAFAMMMAEKGYDCNDTSLATLVTQLYSLQTSNDYTGGLQTVAYAASVAFNCTANSKFEITLTGDCSASFINQAVGQSLTIVVVQGGAGGHKLTLTNGLGHIAGTSDPGSVSIQQFLVVSDSSIRASGPVSSS